jgi:hypothetical protein
MSIPLTTIQIATIVLAPLTTSASSVANWDDKNVATIQVTNNCLDNNVVQMSNKKLHHIHDV